VQRVGESDESMRGLDAAIEVGRKNGWDAKQMESMLNERAMIEGLKLDLREGKPMSCDRLAKKSLWYQQTVAKGERAIGREHLARSGKTSTELVEQYRKKYPNLPTTSFP
jgi:hypothetical protein